ncbi:hypothetical protein [Streptomyces sp. NPDC020917]|uniref:hypothetical protein n=1 Tax=Streptomyces sp. NPDC020917 TaxID=3365102 RepID=UPI0037922F54
MILSISGVLLFGVFTVLAVRSRATSFPAAAAVFLFGFYVAATGAAHPINQFMASVAQSIAQMRG